MHSQGNHSRVRGQKIRTKAKRRGGAGQLCIEQLETRELLAVAVGPLSGTEGFLLSGQIATFASSDVQGTSPTATIAWGDGHTTAGSVVPSGTDFAVDGANTYAVNGMYTVTVTVNGNGGSSASGHGTATINPVSPVATGTTITPVAGAPFTGIVASFTEPYPGLTAANYAATVAWGDGHTTTGTVESNGTGRFNVTGTNTYGAAGTKSVTVTITRMIDGQSAIATSSAVIVAPSITASGTTIIATAEQPFTGTVAMFSDGTPGAVPSDYHASISWGNGQSAVGMVVASGPGSFNVVGSTVFGISPSNVQIVVTIVRNSDGVTATANSAGIITSASTTLGGELNPLSDTGVSNTDGVTAINYPSFFGTATPYAVVQFYARRIDQAQPVLLGQAVASASGSWNFAVGALPNGAYTFSVAQLPTNGSPTPMTLLTPGNVIIDTEQPRTVAASGSSKTSQIAITFKDNLSGLDRTTVMNRLNYALIGPHGIRVHPASVLIVPSAAVASNDPITVTLRFDQLPKNRAHLKIALGGITDVAGNGLAREYVKVHMTSRDPAAIRSSRPGARAIHKARHV
jgi:hypothetical protein